MFPRDSAIIRRWSESGPLRFYTRGKHGVRPIYIPLAWTARSVTHAAMIIIIIKVSADLARPIHYERTTCPRVAVRVGPRAPPSLPRKSSRAYRAVHETNQVRNDASANYKLYTWPARSVPVAAAAAAHLPTFRGPDLDGLFHQGVKFFLLYSSRRRSHVTV